jgi:amino acid transporter
MVAMSISELASRYPTSAGPYYWSFQLAGKKHRELLDPVLCHTGSSLRPQIVIHYLLDLACRELDYFLVGSACFAQAMVELKPIF